MRKKKDNRIPLLIGLVAYAYFIGAICLAMTGSAIGFNIGFGVTLLISAKFYEFI